MSGGSRAGNDVESSRKKFNGAITLPKVDLRKVFQGSFLDAAEYDESSTYQGPSKGKELVTREDELLLDHGEYSHLTDSYARVDLDTDLEKALSYIAFGFSFCALWMYYVSYSRTDYQSIQSFAIVALVAIIVRMTVDCTYVLDNTNRVLLYSRSIFGVTSTFEVARYSDVQKVGIQSIQGCRKNRWSRLKRLYYVVLKLNNGAIVSISDPVSFRGLAITYARSLSTHLESEFVLPQTCHDYLTGEEEVPMKEVSITWKTPSLMGKPGYWEYIVLVASFSALYLGYF